MMDVVLKAPVIVPSFIMVIYTLVQIKDYTVKSGVATKLKIQNIAVLN